jgi:hypothetical protein
MITGQFEILRAFSTDLNIELTINQISKIIKKSYAYTNKYTHELIKEDILKTKKIGSAILCSLNYDNNNTIAALVYNSIKDTPQIKKEFKEDIVISYNGKLLKFMLNDSRFENKIAQLDFSKIRIVKGHEMFWRLIAKI